MIVGGRGAKLRRPGRRGAIKSRGEESIPAPGPDQSTFSLQICYCERGAARVPRPVLFSEVSPRTQGNLLNLSFEALHL